MRGFRSEPDIERLHETHGRHPQCERSGDAAVPPNGRVRRCALSPLWARAAAADRMKRMGEGALDPLTHHQNWRVSQCPLPQRGEGASICVAAGGYAATLPFTAFAQAG